MMITVDCGNTNATFAIFNNHDIIFKFNIITKLICEPKELLNQVIFNLNAYKIDISEIKIIKIASVVLEANEVFEGLKKLVNIPVIILQNTDIKIKNNTTNPQAVGIDRLLNTYYASTLSKSKNVLVIDFGTATNFDLACDNVFEGGVICAGIKTILNSLTNNTSRIFNVELKQVKNIIGKNTGEAVNSGIYFGYAFLVNGIVLEITKQYQDLEIFLTGGMCEFLKHNLDFRYKIDYDLTLKAIRAI